MTVDVIASSRWTSRVLTPFLSASTARCALLSARLPAASVDASGRNGVVGRPCPATRKEL